MREGRESPDIVFRWLVMIIVVELALLSTGLDLPPVGVEAAAFVGP
jgi:hypothetical protein